MNHGKYARVERERRFLLRELPEGLTRASEHLQIWDNYITNTRLRLRKIRVPQTKEYTWKLTQKFAPAPPDFSRTIITNIYLTEYEYEVLSVFEGNEIRKNRYPYEHEGRAYLQKRALRRTRRWTVSECRRLLFWMSRTTRCSRAQSWWNSQRIIFEKS
jgi:hypothetical protein